MTLMVLMLPIILGKVIIVRSTLFPKAIDGWQQQIIIVGISMKSFQSDKVFPCLLAFKTQ